MATTLDTLVARTRRFMRDYPAPVDITSASLSSSVTTVPVSDGTQFAAGWAIEIGYETMLVRSVSSNNLTVLRGYAGSTAASYATSQTVMIRPAFYTVEVIDALNAAKDEMFPLVYKPVLDTSLTSDGATYEFTVPNLDSTPMPYVSAIDIQISGYTNYRPVQNWTIKRGATPKIKFRSPPEPGTLRVHGFGPFADLTASTSTVDAQFPKNAEQPLVLGAASRLLGSGEAGRLRQDTGSRDDREAANRPGGSISLANQLERRFEKALARAAMPPMPPHVVGTF